MKKLILSLLFCAVCVDWTRFRGTVKAINQKDSTVTILNKDGDLIVIPVDYQVKIEEKHGEQRGLLNLQLDEKVTLIRTPRADVPKTESFEEMNRTK